MQNWCRVFSHGQLFLYLRQARIEPSNKRRIVWQKAFYLQCFRLQILSTEKNEQKEIGSSIFRMFSPRRCLSRMRPILINIFTALPHFHESHVGLLRSPLSFPGALFLRFVLFWLTRCGVGSSWEISISIGAWTTCIFVETYYLAKFRGFLLFWWLLCVPQPIIHNSLWHRRLACTCHGSQLFRGFGKQFV